MSEILTCPWCNKPRATRADWERYEGGEGTHLCWADPRCEMDGDEEIVVVQPASSRDWAADLATASTPDEVRAVWAEVKAARVVTPQLEIAIRRRLYDVQDEAPDPVPAPEEDEPQIPVRRQPQDHKPSTRKQQRQRKGRR